MIFGTNPSPDGRGVPFENQSPSVPLSRCFAPPSPVGRGNHFVMLIVLSILAITLGIVGLLDGIRSARHIRTYRPTSTWRPRVLVICPCKGVEPEFSANAESILNQDYPNLRTVFVVEADGDPVKQ